MDYIFRTLVPNHEDGIALAFRYEEMDYRNLIKAKEFTMQHLKEKNRATRASDDRTKRLTIDIPAQLHKTLKIKAVTDGVTMAEIVRQLLVRQLVQNDGQ